MSSQEIDELENRISLLEGDIDELNSEIAAIRDNCDHVRTDYPGVTNPWWCKECGGAMPDEPVQPVQPGQSDE